MLTELRNFKTPLFIGFEDILNFIDNLENQVNSYPPYNLVKTGDNTWVIEVAVAGYSEKDISVVYENGKLLVQSDGINSKEENRVFLHKGISSKKFKLFWRLSEYVEVEDCKLQNGILTIHLKKNIPEHLKPKTIEIKRIN
ncbi:MAG: Hsp20 family protein [Candidatus Dojkabacteria bacterium]|nr:Hsp20 family protein [Candidatus Dojkabacteria bacterium]